MDSVEIEERKGASSEPDISFLLQQTKAEAMAAETKGAGSKPLPKRGDVSLLLNAF
jgi:hypothetical protein